MAKETKPSDIETVFASNALPSDIVPDSETKVKDGFLAEIPTYENFNYWFNRFAKFIRYINERGIADHDSNTVYYINGQCVKNGIHYISLTDDNSGNDPVATLGGHWKLGYQTAEQLNEIIQFAPYNPALDYTLGDIVQGTDKKYYEIYKSSGIVQGQDPAVVANRFPTVFDKWIVWDGVPTGQISMVMGSVVPEGYVSFKATALDKTDYYRLANAPGAFTDPTHTHITNGESRFPVNIGASFNASDSGGSNSHDHANTTTTSDGGHTPSGAVNGNGAHTTSAISVAESSHTHTIAIVGHALTANEMPAHSHTVPAGQDDNSSGAADKAGYNGTIPTSTTSTVGGGAAHNHGASASAGSSHNHTITVSGDGAHSHTFAGNAVGSHTHDLNLPSIGHTPQYIAVNYIVKC